MRGRVISAEQHMAFPAEGEKPRIVLRVQLDREPHILEPHHIIGQEAEVLLHVDASMADEVNMGVAEKLEAQEKEIKDYRTAVGHMDGRMLELNDRIMQVIQQRDNARQMRDGHRNTLEMRDREITRLKDKLGAESEGEDIEMLKANLEDEENEVRLLSSQKRALDRGFVQVRDERDKALDRAKQAIAQRDEAVNMRIEKEQEIAQLKKDVMNAGYFVAGAGVEMVLGVSSEARFEAVKAILDERRKQDHVWGDAHDDDHTMSDWSRLVGRYMTHAKNFNDLAQQGGGGDSANARKKLVKAAAVALAAIESYDRTEGTGGG